MLLTPLLDSVSVLFCEEGNNVQDDLAGLLHTLERNILHLSMEIVSAGEDVRARESHE
jgi:hypothetical protein